MKPINSALLLAALLTSPFAMANRESGGRVGASAVYVDFASYGTGIDTRSLQVYEALVLQAEANDQIVEKTEKLKGREGERLVCVQLSDATVRYQFVRALAPVIVADREKTGHERTDVYVSFDCDDVSAATLQDISAYLR